MTNENTASGQFNLDEILKAFKGFDKASGPDMSRAYLVMPPAMFDQLKMTVEPFEVPRDDKKDALRYSLFNHSLYGMPVYRMHPAVVGRMYSTDPSYQSIRKPIVWRDEVKPTPITRLQLTIIVCSLIMILLLSCSIFN